MNKLFTSIHLKAKDDSIFLDMSWGGETIVSPKHLLLDSYEKSDIDAIRTLVEEGFPFSKILIDSIKVIAIIDIENYNVSIEKQ